MAKKKSTGGIQKRAIITFIVVFLVANCVFIPVRAAAVNFSNKRISHGSTDVPDDPGNTTTQPAISEPVSLIKDMNVITVDESSPFYDVFTSKERVNILACGVADGNTDTIMLVSYDLKNQGIDLISIPRDTYYYRARYTKNYAANKINAIYRTEGITRLAEVVSEFLYGMPIHYYVLIEYSDVREIMKAVGGVEVDIPFRMKYDDTTPGYELHIDIPAGKQTIDSSNVVEFLRFRKGNTGYSGYSGGDMERTEVQRDFVMKLIRKCLTSGNLSDVAKTALETVESDLTYGIATKIVTNALKGLNGDNIRSYMLPGEDRILESLSFWVVDTAAASEMLKEVYSLGDGAQTAQ